MNGQKITENVIFNVNLLRQKKSNHPQNYLNKILNLEKKLIFVTFLTISMVETIYFLKIGLVFADPLPHPIKRPFGYIKLLCKCTILLAV